MRNLITAGWLLFCAVVVCGLAYTCVSSGVAGSGDGGYPLGQYAAP